MTFFYVILEECYAVPVLQEQEPELEIQTAAIIPYNAIGKGCYSFT